MATRYVTGEKLEEVLSSANVKVDDLNLGQLLEDCEEVFEYVSGNPWLTDAELRTWGESSVGIDRLNAALAVLQSSNRVAAVSLTAAQIPEEPTAEILLPDEKPEGEDVDA